MEQQRPLLTTELITQPPVQLEPVKAKTSTTESSKSPNKSTIVVRRNLLLCIAIQIALIIIYSALGSLIFFLLEYQQAIKEKVYKTGCLNNTNIMDKNFDLVLDYSLSSNESSRENAVVAFREASKDLKKCFIHIRERETRSQIKTYMDAMLYVTTVYTTVGYGCIITVTPFGHVFTMLYAIFGIPLYTALVSDLGVVLGRCLINIAIRVKKHLLGSATRLNTIWRFVIFANVSLVACTITTTIVYICERKWSWSKAAYYCFSTVTLIGFGDIDDVNDYFNFLYMPFFVVTQTLVAITFYFMQHWLRYDAYQIAFSRISGEKTTVRADGTEVNLTIDNTNDAFHGAGSICVNIDSDKAMKPISDNS